MFLNRFITSLFCVSFFLSQSYYTLAQSVSSDEIVEAVVLIFNYEVLVPQSWEEEFLISPLVMLIKALGMLPLVQEVYGKQLIVVFHGNQFLMSKTRIQLGPFL